jgi:hypothetical protein
MSDGGLAVFNANGALGYSSADTTWNQVDFFRVEAGEGIANYYAALVGREALTVQMMIDPPPTNQKATAHTVTVSNNTVYVSGGTVPCFILVLMR